MASKDWSEFAVPSSTIDIPCRNKVAVVVRFIERDQVLVITVYEIK